MRLGDVSVQYTPRLDEDTSTLVRLMNDELRKLRNAVNTNASKLDFLETFTFLRIYQVSILNNSDRSVHTMAMNANLALVSYQSIQGSTVTVELKVDGTPVTTVPASPYLVPAVTTWQTLACTANNATPSGSQIDVRTTLGTNNDQLNVALWFRDVELS